MLKASFTSTCPGSEHRRYFILNPPLLALNLRRKAAHFRNNLCSLPWARKPKASAQHIFHDLRREHAKSSNTQKLRSVRQSQRSSLSASTSFSSSTRHRYVRGQKRPASLGIDPQAATKAAAQKMLFRKTLGEETTKVVCSTALSKRGSLAQSPSRTRVEVIRKMR